MNVIVTVKSFDDNLQQYDFLIPSIKGVMEKVILQLAQLQEPAIDITGINTVHFVDNYRDELFDFQNSVGHHSFATLNKIAMGHAQVVYVHKEESKELEGYHIFFSKLIPMSILVGQYIEDNSEKLDATIVEKAKLEKNVYLRMIRHELAHIEDENNQKEWSWLSTAFTENMVKAHIRYDAYRLWSEFYACQRSNFIYDAEEAVEELTSLMRDLTTAEKEICELRWKYNTHKIELDAFVKSIHEYVRSAYIYGCYFMGHMNELYETINKQIKPELMESRFFHHFPQMWIVLRGMLSIYPNWESAEILDDLANLILITLEEFEVYPEDTEDGVYYSIPPKKIYPLSNNLN